MSKALKHFLRAWLWWAMTGAELKNRYGFRREEGLCWSMWGYYPPRRRYMASNLEAELRQLFVAEDLDCNYPFGCFDFDERNEKKTMHLCPKRLGWVIKTLEENPDA